MHTHSAPEYLDKCYKFVALSIFKRQGLWLSSEKISYSETIKIESRFIFIMIQIKLKE